MLFWFCTVWTADAIAQGAFTQAATGVLLMMVLQQPEEPTNAE